MSAAGQARNVERKARAQTRAHPQWVISMARLGYAAKGLLYLTVGFVAARAAVGVDHPEGAKGAVSRLLEHPIGTLVVALIATGLLGYAGWRLVRAVANPEHDHVGSRIYSVFTALIHLVLLSSVVSALFGSRDNGDSAAGWTARALGAPLGRWLVASVAIGLIANGLWQLYKAVTTRLDDELDFGAMRALVRKVTPLVARAGMSARGVVFGLIGVSLGAAALQADPAEANGLQTALQDIARAKYGAPLLGAVAFGFIAYGLYELILATYRRIRTG